MASNGNNIKEVLQSTAVSGISGKGNISNLSSILSGPSGYKRPEEKKESREPYLHVVIIQGKLADELRIVMPGRLGGSPMDYRVNRLDEEGSAGDGVAVSLDLVPIPEQEVPPAPAFVVPEANEHVCSLLNALEEMGEISPLKRGLMKLLFNTVDENTLKAKVNRGVETNGIVMILRGIEELRSSGTGEKKKKKASAGEILKIFREMSL